MINSIKGIITARLDGSIYLENNGMEWQILASGMTISALPKVGEEARVYTWLYHREDGMSLFGFANVAERNLFNDLISVSGVGPKGALKILSAARSSQIVSYLEEENLEGLASLPGLGKKTAQKVILQLRGKLTYEDSVSGSGASKTPDGEWVESLVAMGFDRPRVKSVVRTLMKDEVIAGMTADKREQEILRRAIVELSS